MFIQTMVKTSMLKRLLLLSGIVVGLSTLTACAGKSSPITSGIGASEMQLGSEYSRYLVVDNKDLAQRLYIKEVKSRTNNGLLEVNLNLQSHYARSQKLQYHFNWFDKDGFAVEPRKTPWRVVELHGKQSTALRGLAPNERVVSFNVYVREIPEKAYKY